VAVELTANFVGDAEVLPDLLEQLDPGETLASVVADGLMIRSMTTQLSGRGMPRP